ncbi:MAG: limonene-1,2-epoxide hydrolase family protein [Dehalococcoidia bacterium]
MARNAADVVRDFCAAFSRLDVDEVMGYFTDDAVYHNMPAQPLNGKDAIRQAIQAFLGNWSRTQWDILNIAADGDIVFTERVDRIWAGDKHVDLPIAGVFEVRDGKIAAWRDYFDMGTYLKAMA